MDPRSMTSVCTIGGRTYVAVDQHGVHLTLQSPAGLQCRSEITPTSARQLARALLTAADDFEQFERTKTEQPLLDFDEGDFPPAM